MKSLNIVIPCHNEEEVIFNTHHIIDNFCKNLKNENIITEYEIVLVNNGSTDNTSLKMEEIFAKSLNTKVIDLRRNYGYQGSITAGLFNTSKEMVVTIDADLQDDYKKIKEMIFKHYEGFDLVLGVRKNRKTDSFFKRHSAEYYYKFLKLLGIDLVFNHGDFRLMSHSLVEDFKKFPEKNRYIRGMIFKLESKFSCVYYEREKRKQGQSKFNLGSLFSLAFDGIASFSISPIRFIFFFGIVVFLLSIIGMSYVFYEKIINGIDVPGWAFTTTFVMLFGGLNSLFIGIIGEYIGRTYIETKQRPIFSIRKIYKK